MDWSARDYFMDGPYWRLTLRSSLALVASFTAKVLTDFTVLVLKGQILHFSAIIILWGGLAPLFLCLCRKFIVIQRGTNSMWVFIGEPRYSKFVFMQMCQTSSQSSESYSITLYFQNMHVNGEVQSVWEKGGTQHCIMKIFLHLSTMLFTNTLDTPNGILRWPYSMNMYTILLSHNNNQVLYLCMCTYHSLASCTQ